MGLFGGNNNAPAKNKKPTTSRNARMNRQDDSSYYLVMTNAYFYDMFAGFCEPKVTVKLDSNKEGGYLVSLSGTINPEFKNATQMFEYIFNDVLSTVNGTIIIKDVRLDDAGFTLNFSVRF